VEIKKKKRSNGMRIIKFSAVMTLCILSFLAGFLAGRYFEKAEECKARGAEFREVMEQIYQDRPRDVVYVDCYALRLRRDGFLEVFKIDERK